MASFINADDSEYQCPECGSQNTYENYHDQFYCRSCEHETTVEEAADPDERGSVGGIV